MGGEESRRFPRVKRPFMLKCRCPSRGQADWAVSSLQDVSAKGLRFIGEQVFPHGTVLELQLWLPPDLTQPLMLKGSVVWQRLVGASALWEHGVMFVDMDPVTQQRIAERVHAFLGKSPPQT